MKRVALYLRVSKSDQNCENQRLELHKWASQKGYEIAAEYTDHGISGAKGRDERPQLDAMLKAAIRGEFDMLAVWSVDRLGRSLQDLLSTFEELKAASVGLYLHRQAIDSSSPAGKALLQMTGVFAEFEREMIRERIHAGIARAKTYGTRTGKAFGRPKVDSNKADQIINLLQQRLSVREAAKRAKSSVGTVSRIRLRLKEEGRLPV